MSDRPTETSRPKDFDGEDEQTRALAPENANSEQDDAGAQAQTVAEEVLAGEDDAFRPQDSEKTGGDPALADAQDLVDHMNQMVTSGRIDMSAYRGEPNFDDEEGQLGPGAEEDDGVPNRDQG